jgi:hypothetical protein
MKHLFLFGGMTLFSAFAFSQELRVSNQRTAVADPNQKEIPASEQNVGGTLVIQPVERAMSAANTVTPAQENSTNPSEGLVVNPMERTATPANPNQPVSTEQKESKVNTTKGKPE